MPHEKWCNRMRELLAKNERITNKDENFIEAYSTAEYLIRFLVSYPIQVAPANKHFVKTVLKKCSSLMKEIRSIQDEYDLCTQQRYKTRKTVAKLQELNKRNVMCEKLRRELGHCHVVYWKILYQIRRAKRATATNLSSNRHVAVANPV